MIQDIMRFSSDEYEGLSDEEILTLSRTTPDVFGVLVARYEDAFLRKAKSILWSQEDAEEVVQDTFTRIYVYADRYKPQVGASFSSWGYTILTRLAYTRYSKARKLQGRTLSMDPEAFERLPEQSDFRDTLVVTNEVLVALSKIPEQFSRVLRLQFIEGLTQEEIAEKENASIPAIKTRVHRAKKLFKQAHKDTTTI
jgi:RNA polymerase sigma-70 factor, ECF subfamily